MLEGDSRRVTLLLNQWSDGSDAALEELMPLVYDELHTMAKRYMRGQNKGHTFQTTELIHEAYLKLAGGEKKDWKNRAHFLGVAALVRWSNFSGQNPHAGIINQSGEERDEEI